jgi:translation initiation factor 5A
MSEEDEHQDFETGNAGSADCIPTQCGSIKKGGYCMLKGHPCKVTEYSTAKPGKHGSAKATIVGTLII